MSEVVILSAARTAIGVEQVYMGCVLPAGIGQAPARQAALGAGCPRRPGPSPFNKVCGSAMRTDDVGGERPARRRLRAGRRRRHGVA
jgi:acetyl-CoA acetyltransferase